MFVSLLSTLAQPDTAQPCTPLCQPAGICSIQQPLLLRLTLDSC